jgi:small subunit ribosomal protein S30e
VRNQTPKVAPTEKKKKKTGRAKKRMLYNRRFVTQVVGFGGKRGVLSTVLSACCILIHIA